MSNFRKNLEVVTNIAILVVGVIFVVVLIQKFYFTPEAKSKNLEVGSEFKLTDVNWKENDKTLVLVMKKECVYCSKSAGFYQKLIPAAKEKSVKTIAVLPSELDESKKYIEGLELPEIEIKKAELPAMEVAATPTLILVDKEGKVLNSWVGQLTPDKEEELLGKL